MDEGPVAVAGRPGGNDPKHVIGRVVTRREISSELWIVRVRPEEKIAFSPGQYVTIGLPGSVRMVERAYSIVSSPTEPELEFFLEMVPGGELTPQLYTVAVGGEVYLRRITKGRFLYDARSGHPNHFMIATVTGIAPYVSMLREMAERAGVGEQVPGRIVVLHAASLPQELGYFDELSDYSREHHWLHYVPTVSRIWETPAWPGERGRAEDVTRMYLGKYGFTPVDTTAYMCGNPQMIENVKGVLRRAGFPKDSVKEEVYWLAQKG
jgi:ferredoxin--NADP+ reductase